MPAVHIPDAIDRIMVLEKQMREILTGQAGLRPDPRFLHDQSHIDWLFLGGSVDPDPPYTYTPSPYIGDGWVDPQFDEFGAPWIGLQRATGQMFLRGFMQVSNSFDGSPELGPMFLNLPAPYYTYRERYAIVETGDGDDNGSGHWTGLLYWGGGFFGGGFNQFNLDNVWVDGNGVDRTGADGPFSNMDAGDIIILDGINWFQGYDEVHDPDIPPPFE